MPLSSRYPCPTSPQPLPLRSPPQGQEPSTGTGVLQWGRPQERGRAGGLKAAQRGWAAAAVLGPRGREGPVWRIPALGLRSGLTGLQHRKGAVPGYQAQPRPSHHICPAQWILQGLTTEVGAQSRSQGPRGCAVLQAPHALHPPVCGPGVPPQRVPGPPACGQSRKDQVQAHRG